MFNDGPGSDDYLVPVAALIDDLCRVIRFEPRGCGRADWDGNYDIDTVLCDAKAVRDAYSVELRAELRKAVRRIVVAEQR